MAKVRTASSGDPVTAWDGYGRLFMGSESSGDPAGTKKGFGDVWVARFDNPGGEGGATINDGKRFLGTTTVAKGSSSPGTGKFNDKTAIEADRSGSVCDGNVYIAWSRFTGVGVSNIYFSRSTDHGVTWSAPMLLTSNTSNVQDPEVSVTGNGHVYVTFDQGATNSGQAAGAAIAKSTDCGATFGKPVVVTTYVPYTAQDVQSPQPISIPAASVDDPLSEDDVNESGWSGAGLRRFHERLPVGVYLLPAGHHYAVAGGSIRHGARVYLDHVRGEQTRNGDGDGNDLRVDPARDGQPVGRLLRAV